MNDSQLLQEYATSHDDGAFRSLVDQYLGLVYSACLRQLRDRHHAEDAAQAVFILLSQKAGGLHQSYLTGWLLTTSRYVCANIRKREQRRQRREQLAAMNQPMKSQTSSLDLLDLLDEALGHLKKSDREALVLRYLKDQPIGTVAETLGISQETARKRVYRSLEKLRNYFTRRGIATTSAALGPLLTEQLPGVALAPAARHAITQGILQVCRAGPQSAAASLAIAKGTKSMMLLAKLKGAAAAAVIAAAIGTTGWVISKALADNTSPPQLAAPVSAPPSAAPLVASAPASTLPTTAPSALTDVTQILRWSVLLDDPGYDTIKQANPQAIESTTKNLTPGTCQTDSLHAAILQAIQNNDAVCVSALHAYSPKIWTAAQTQNVLVDLSQTAPTGYPAINGGGWGTLHSELVDVDHRSLQLNFPALQINLRESADQNTNANFSLTYNGVLASGNSLVFIANLPASAGSPLHLLIAYETVKAPDWEMEYFALVQDLQWYLNSNPEAVSIMAKRALLWAASAQHDQSVVSPKFQKKLPDGTIAEVTAVTFMNEFPFCWWDAEGHAVDADQNVALNPRSMARPAYSQVEITGPGGKWANAYPLGPPNHADFGRYPNIQMGLSMGHSGHASFWVPYGSWTQIGQIKVGDSIISNGTTYRLLSVNGEPPGQIYAALAPNRRGGDCVTLTAVLNNGQEIGALSPSATIGKMDNNEPPIFAGFNPSDVKFFHVWQRKRQFVTFSNLPEAPVDQPREDATPDEIAAALARLNEMRQNPSTQPAN